MSKLLTALVIVGCVTTTQASTLNDMCELYRDTAEVIMGVRQKDTPREFLLSKLPLNDNGTVDYRLVSIINQAYFIKSFEKPDGKEWIKGNFANSIYLDCLRGEL